jgi:hypothetical protein
VDLAAEIKDLAWFLELYRRGEIPRINLRGNVVLTCPNPPALTLGVIRGASSYMRLFRKQGGPAAGGDTRLIEYRLLLRDGGASSYVLTGRKTIHDEVGTFDLWADVRTLEFEMKRNGEPYLAGVLEVPAAEFFGHQLSSLEATNTKDPARRIWALSAFGSSSSATSSTSTCRSWRRSARPRGALRSAPMSEAKKTETFRRKDGIKLRQYPRGGMPVLLLHGAGASSSTFTIPGPDIDGNPRCLRDWLWERDFEPWLLDWWELRGGEGEDGEEGPNLLLKNFHLDKAATRRHPLGAQDDPQIRAMPRDRAVGHRLGAGALAQAIAMGRSPVEKPPRLTHVVLLTLGSSTSRRSSGAC